jgi:hypothetical protein
VYFAALWEQVSHALDEPSAVPEDEHRCGQSLDVQSLLLLPEERLHGLDRLLEDRTDLAATCDATTSRRRSAPSGG